MKRKEELKFADTVLQVSYLTTIWPNFSQIGPGAGDLEFKMHAELAQIFISRKKENSVSTVMRLETPRRKANKLLIDKRKYQFS